MHTFSFKNSGDVEKHVCTVHAPNKKDAMTPSCLDRKEVRGAIWGVYITGTGQLVRALCTHIRGLFLSFGGPVCADRLAIVHWIGCINAIKLKILIT